jgi:hypothetical protein
MPALLLEEIKLILHRRDRNPNPCHILVPLLNKHTELNSSLFSTSQFFNNV